MVKRKKEDQDVRSYPNPIFTNYDLYEFEDGDETSPGIGLYDDMKRYKFVKDFLEKARKRQERKKKARLEQLWSIAAVLDLTEKFKEKRNKEEQEDVIKKLKEVSKSDVEKKPDIETSAPIVSEIHKQTGVWSHRFSDIMKNDEGFYILKSDTPHFKKMSVGDLLTDLSLNHTPYWRISKIDDKSIYLEPIGSNPFKTGVGAGGAKLTQHDVDVFSGEYEKRRFESIQKKFDTGDATISDVVYLLDGTVPVNMGPNGAQGGWYTVTNTWSNRGGKKGKKPKQIMIDDANRLKSWGFHAPIKALDGTMDPYDFSKWIEGNGSSDIDYIPRNLEKYVDFHKRMVQQGKWRMEPDIEKLRQQTDEKYMEAYWNVVLNDFLKMSKKEFQFKYKYMEPNLQWITQVAKDSIEQVKKRKEKFKYYFVEGEEDTEESVLKAIYHPERRVAIRNIMYLIELCQEESKYVKYLHDYVNLGGNDWYANEKVINFFNLIDDVEGLKLAAENFRDPTNQRYALCYLFDQGEEKFVLDKLEDQQDFEVIKAVFYKILEKAFGGKYKLDKPVRWIIDFAKRKNLFDKIEDSILIRGEGYMADELISAILRSYAVGFDLNELDEQDRAEYLSWQDLLQKYKKEKK